MELRGSYDVVVVGGGVSGTAAAVAAARCGARVLLVERYGFLGGTTTASSVCVLMNFYLRGQPLVGGVLLEVIGRLRKLGGYDDETRVFDPELMKVVLEELALEAGVELLYHATFVDVVRRGRDVRGVVLRGKGGLQLALSEVAVDATGDGDVAAAAGCPFEKGRSADGLTQPATLMFVLANVGEDALPPLREVNRAFAEARRSGELSIPREGLIWFKGLGRGLLLFNATRITKIDGTSSADLTRAEVEGRRQVMAVVSWLRRRFPEAFRDAVVIRSGPQVGIRETRRVIGEYVLTEEDVLSARKFPDAVCRACYPVDIHSPLGEGTVLKYPPPGDYYEIPYRCLVPLGAERLLVTGRCISATHEALAATRIIPTCFGLGQAAGVAAALCAEMRASPRQLSASLLREKLREQGAVV